MQYPETNNATLRWPYSDRSFDHASALLDTFTPDDFHIAIACTSRYGMVLHSCLHAYLDGGDDGEFMALHRGGYNNRDMVRASIALAFARGSNT